ncbi:efflux transporter periplasmic adaptor subunit [Aliidiomarina minuta]|uniref:Efflux transporter periplasmic adaptor subunit n=1 Tax=Aliidiomarina minuta TaxID=880057 RepID=A0A432WAG1_9GAMM|nr:HlyD family efflux transporter periplasmic adaptor subunit [Aliidiomarina minuta]RUO26588.1 efflux transporter periplasmic adaptor subunit [Aliidiomarina minuta]
MDRQLEKKRFPVKKLGMAAVLIAISVVAVWQLNPSQSRLQSTLTLQDISVATVEPRVLRESISLRASAVPQQTVFLDLTDGGRVEERLVEQGSYVEKGDPLVQLSNTSLQLDLISREAQVTEQMNFLRNTQMTIETNHLNLQRDILDLKYQIQTLKRHIEQSEKLHARSMLSEEELTSLRQSLSYQQSLLELARQRQTTEEAIRELQLSQLEDSVDMLTRNLEFARQNVSNLLVRAPISGYLSEFNVETGESRGAGSRLGQIDLPERYKLVASIDEFYLNRVQLGMSASATIAGQTLDLKVDRIDSRVTSSQFQIEFYLTDDIRMTRGQSFNLTLHLEDGEKKSLAIPRGPFLQESGGHFVYVFDEDSRRAVRTPVRLGRQTPQWVEVLEGVSAGTRIITSSYRDFQQADSIQIQQ